MGPDVVLLEILAAAASIEPARFSPDRQDEEHIALASSAYAAADGESRALTADSSGSAAPRAPGFAQVAELQWDIALSPRGKIPPGVEEPRALVVDVEHLNLARAVHGPEALAHASRSDAIHGRARDQVFEVRERSLWDLGSTERRGKLLQLILRTRAVSQRQPAEQKGEAAGDRGYDPPGNAERQPVGAPTGRGVHSPRSREFPPVTISVISVSRCAMMLRFRTKLARAQPTARKPTPPGRGHPTRREWVAGDPK